METSLATDSTPAIGPAACAPAAPEADLVERAKTDPAAFGTLYEMHYDRILNYIYRRTLNVAVAEELTSNTFFKALRHLPRYRPRAPFQAWLYRIATNEIKMHWRTEKRRHTRQKPFNAAELDRVYFTAPEADDAQEARRKMQQFALVQAAITKLGHRYQTVLALRYFEGMRNEQIAQVLGKKIGTVKSLISRGLGRLRKIIGDQNATFSSVLHSQDGTGGQEP